MKNKGEERVVEFLKLGLPLFELKESKFEKPLESHYQNFLLTNFEIPDRSAGRFLEIDDILITPHALYVIEVKDWGNQIFGDDRTWVLNNYREKPNPHRTLNYKCRVIQSALVEFNPQLRHIWVQGIVVIARENTLLNLTGQCKKLTFELNENLIQFLKDPNRLELPKNRSVNKDGIKDLQLLICKALLGEAQFRKDDKPKIIQGYQIEEELRADEHLTEYLGTKILNGVKHGNQKRLRIFNLPNTLASHEQQQYQQRLLRDFEALEEIGSHPNIVSLKGAIDDESGKFIEVLDWSEDGSLRTVLSQRKLPFQETLFTIRSIARGLKTIHNKKIIHRALRPENILMTLQGPQIMNFDRSYLYKPQGQTVWQTVTEPEELIYLPPELALPMSEYDCMESSDLYSLGVIWYEMICGDVPFANPAALEEAGGILPDDLLPSTRVDGVPKAVDILIKHLYSFKPEERFTRAEDFIEQFDKAFLPSQPVVIVRDNPPKYEPPAEGERISDYELVRPLGSSGYFSEIYLARHFLFRNKLYALKVNKRGSIDLDNLIDEFTILDQLHHPHIVKVSTGSQLPDGRFFLAMEYLEGQSVREQIEDIKEQSLTERLQTTRTLGEQMLSAMRYLHEPDQKEGELAGTVLLHRDIKPENIMYVPTRGYVLVDFNIAKQVQPESTQTMTGTKPYIPPDLMRIDNIDWEQSADTFALGCTLFELLTGYHPYQYKPRLDQEPLDLNQIPGSLDLPEAFCAFLIKAVQTRSSKRFQSAKAMEEALKACFELPGTKPKPSIEPGISPIPDLTPQPVGVFQPSPWIRFLRQYGPIARNGNMYDESIQRELKRTGMDPLAFKTEYLRELRENFQNMQPCSVILTGTAGDGKTYTCRRVWQLLKGGDDGSWEEGGMLPSMRLDTGKQLTVIKDLSEVDDAQAQDLIGRMARSILGENPDEVFLVAANDGQLMERWTRALQDPAVQRVHPILEEMLVTDIKTQDGYKLILHNLSRIVRERLTYQDMFQKLLQHEGWNHCNTCPYQQAKCPIWENRSRLEGKEDGQLMQKRLVDLLELSQLNDRHLTTRQLLLLMANALLGHPDAKEHLLRCEDVPDQVDKGTLHLASIYRNLFGENLTPRKREAYDVFEALNQFGIGYETNNRIDDTLIFGNDSPDFQSDYRNWIKQDNYYGEYQSFRGYQESYIEGEVNERQEFLNLLRDQRQRLFFVIPESQLEEAQLWHLTVYHAAGQYLSLYHALRQKKPHPNQHVILRQLMRGFNRIMTGLPTTTQDELYLATSGCYTQAKVSTVWEGAIPIGPIQGQGIALLLGKTQLPSMAIQFLSSPSKIREDFSLPLYRFEFLSRVADGLLPGSFSNEYYKDILAIKTRLLRRWDDYKAVTVVGTEDDIFGSMPVSQTIDLQFVDLEPAGNIRLVKVAVNLPADGDW